MINLSHNDTQFLKRVLMLPREFKELFESVSIQGISLSEDQADELRDLCGDRLQTHGFDEKYQPTEEGKILEELIDKLFIG